VFQVERGGVVEDRLVVVIDLTVVGGGLGGAGSLFDGFPRMGQFEILRGSSGCYRLSRGRFGLSEVGFRHDRICMLANEEEEEMTVGAVSRIEGGVVWLRLVWLVVVVWVWMR
jgi:hypothetical protein